MTKDGLARDQLARGTYLVEGPAGCGNCHTPLGPEGFVSGQELSGRLVDKNPAFTAYAPNITPAGRIAGWSDAQLARAIREGLRPDGSVIGPPMPIAMYRGLSDSDLMAIVAYLRAAPAVDNEVPQSAYNIPLPPAYGPPVKTAAAPPAGATAAYGAYLAGPVAHCMECHTPMGPQGPLFDTRLGAGGFEFNSPLGVVVAANITSHPEDGLARYSDAQLDRMIRQGIDAQGEPMRPPMPYSFLAKMTDEDTAAVIAYLRSLPPLASRD